MPVMERLNKFLERFDGPLEDRLVQVRAVELLEHLGTMDAKAVLKKLAGGGPSRQTADAASALKRLAARP